jgi:hypothetical protein
MVKILYLLNMPARERECICFSRKCYSIRKMNVATCIFITSVVVRLRQWLNFTIIMAADQNALTLSAQMEKWKVNFVAAQCNFENMLIKCIENFALSRVSEA